MAIYNQQTFLSGVYICLAINCNLIGGIKVTLIEAGNACETMIRSSCLPLFVDTVHNRSDHNNLFLFSCCLQYYVYNNQQPVQSLMRPKSRINTEFNQSPWKVRLATSFFFDEFCCRFCVTVFCELMPLLTMQLST